MSVSECQDHSNDLQNKKIQNNQESLIDTGHLGVVGVRLKTATLTCNINMQH